MQLLILGGTLFLGRHLVDAALARGHQVTLFHRGRTNPDLFPQLEHLLGDRTTDLSPLAGRRWDAVIDTCGYHPPVVRQSAQALADAVDHYTFISSISVYPEFTTPGIDETFPVATLPAGIDETVKEITGETYGPLKALCEAAVSATLPGRDLNIRPGLIVGPFDRSDRFPYWPTRIARGGEVLAPGRPGRLVQIIDVRDLAEWTVTMVEGRRTGTYNATGPTQPLTMQAVLDTCLVVAGQASPAPTAPAELTWVDDDFLVEQGVGAYSDMPLWIPHEDDTVSIALALNAGLTFRPLADTVRDTLAWDATRPSDEARRAGMGAEREGEVLGAWHEVRGEREKA